MFNTCTQRAAEERLKCVICQDEEVSFLITLGNKTRLNMHIAHRYIETLQQIRQNLFYSPGRKCSYALRPSLLLHKLCGQGSIFFCCLEQRRQSGIFIHFNSFVVLNLFCQLFQLYFMFKNIFIKIYLIPQIPRCPMCRTLIHVRTKVFIN